MKLSKFIYSKLKTSINGRQIRIIKRLFQFTSYYHREKTRSLFILTSVVCLLSLFRVQLRSKINVLFPSIHYFASFIRRSRLPLLLLTWQNSSISKSSYVAVTIQKKISLIAKVDQSTDKQGMIFDQILKTKLMHYFDALSNHTGGSQNIIAASRINKNRIIIFLKTTDINNHFFHNHFFIEIANDVIQIRRLRLIKN